MSVDSDDSNNAKTHPKQRVVSRLEEANLPIDRFITVKNGGKASTDHTQRQAGDLSGNIGVYAGRGLVILDDDTDPDTSIPGIDDLRDTFTVGTPNGGNHQYYAVENAPELLKSKFDVFNPVAEWGEVRVKNQYVVGPGSKNPEGDVRETYTITRDTDIAEISPQALVAALRASGYGKSDNSNNTDSRDTDKNSGVEETDLSDTELIETAKNAENGKQFKRLWNGGTAGYNSHSEADLALCNHLAFYTGNDKSRIDSLFRKSGLCREKWTDRRDYRNRTIQKAVDATEETYNAENSITEKFITACERYQIDSSKVGTIAVDGEKQFIGVHGIVSGLNIPEAVFKFKREASQLSGEEKQAVIGHAVLLDLQDNGEFFKTPAGELYYFSDDERQVYRVDEGGRKILTDDFRNFAHEQYNLFAGKFSRNLGKDVKGQAQRGAPERDVYRLSHYDESAGELYINDFENGYYAVTAESIEWRSNGTDVFFLPNERAESYDYLSPSERPSLPDKVPGERPLWCGSGDALMRLFGNRVNYDETAALGPSEQRKQLYLHLHTLPFIDVLNARPIMAWIGEKGSGKTVLQRSIGRFMYGTDFTESIMPDSKDDFLAKVTNQPLAFLDNYDDGVDWANDILAAIATGAGIDKRELYTTNSLHREVPRCWLSLTSRDPPFRRDDVADRTLVFRVERVESGFIGMGDYLQQITAYRNLLWSEYLDNLQAVIREYHERDTASMSSDHRMADWAIFAKIIGDALGVNDVSTLLETMETERSTFALENEDWANVCSHWLQDSPTVAGEWHSAGELVDLLTSYAEKNDLPMGINHAAGLGGKLSSYRNEMQELYDLEIDDSGRSNKYRFDTGKGHSPSNLQSY